MKHTIRTLLTVSAALLLSAPVSAKQHIGSLDTAAQATAPSTDAICCREWPKPPAPTPDSASTEAR